MKRGTNPRNAKGQFTSEKKIENIEYYSDWASRTLFFVNQIIDLLNEHEERFNYLYRNTQIQWEHNREVKDRLEKLENPKTTWTYKSDNSDFVYKIHNGHCEKLTLEEASKIQPQTEPKMTDKQCDKAVDDWGCKYFGAKYRPEPKECCYHKSKNGVDYLGIEFEVAGWHYCPLCGKELK
jgi:hypothetical protein